MKHKIKYQMPGEFSFLVNDLTMILRYAHHLFPGIRRIDAVYYDQSAKTLKALTTNPQDDQPLVIEMAIEGSANDVEKLRKVKSPFSWFSEEELPFNQINQPRRIPDVFSELQKVVLVIRIPNEADNRSDLLFIYFTENMTNFGISMSNKELKPEYKEMIGQMIQNSIRAKLKMANDDRIVWQNVREMIMENRHKMEQNTRKMEELMQRYEERLVDSCNYFLSNISEKEGRKYLFSEGALKLIKSSSVDYHRIENAIKLAVELAKNFDIGDRTDLIEITEDFLNFNAAKVDSSERSMTDTIYEKPFNYLTLLEEAAEKVNSARQPMTAHNVVNALERPVKPPAVSWMVNHNMKAFKHLFKLYPEKWPLIRSQFKPILRIMGPDEGSKTV
ncbi:MAG: hypothetical protein IH598_14085 [Bacteroidales bacterium]|nr:hypothetical protein [Bacteroidales bacterium]